MTRREIEEHLQSAVSRLTPDVLDRIDLTAPQEIHTEFLADKRRSRARMWGAAAACVLVVAAGSGGYELYRGSLIDSIVGLDVNPSVELSVNRKEKVLKAEALNEDAQAVLDGMDLKGVKLNVAVNAVVGAMAAEGYLEDLDSAILVTVMGDSVSRTSVLRSQVVADVEKSLEENQVQAVVYDQQAVIRDDVRETADEYGISYGKAYFLEELIGQSPVLTEEDLARLSGMTMEEIAKEVAGETPQLQLPVTEETAPAESGGEETAETAGEGGSSSEEAVLPGETPAAEVDLNGPGETGRNEAEDGEEEEKEDERVRLDEAWYEDGEIAVTFEDGVRWRSPAVSVRGRDGEYLAARLVETDGKGCRIEAEGMEPGETYYFTVAGMVRRGGESLTAVSGRIRVPEDGTEEESRSPQESRPEESTSGESGAGESRPQEDGELPQESSEAAETEALEESRPQNRPDEDGDVPERPAEGQRPSGEPSGSEEDTGNRPERETDASVNDKGQSGTETGAAGDGENPPETRPGAGEAGEEAPVKGIGGTGGAGTTSGEKTEAGAAGESRR